MFTKLFRSLFIVYFGGLFQLAAPLLAAVPQLISYQGRVVVDGVNFDSEFAGHSGIFRFALVNGDGSATYWSNDGSSVGGSEPIAGVSLEVSKGLYSVSLGDASGAPGMVPITPSVFANSDVRLRVWFDDGTHGSQLLSPDQRIASVAFAMTAQTVPAGAIGSSQLASEAVQSAHIAPGAVGNMQLANSGISIETGPGLTGGGTLALGGVIALGIDATEFNTPSSIIRRDGNGNFAANAITGSLIGNATTATTAASAGLSTMALNFLGTLEGDVTGGQGTTVVGKINGITPASVNAPGAVVVRDASGNFSAGAITATTFSGDGSGLTKVPGALPWRNVADTAQQAEANVGYLANNAGLVTITLPQDATAGDIVRVTGVGIGGWAIAPGASQSVAGFPPGLGPTGSQGDVGAVQNVGGNSWRSISQAQLSDGAVHANQIATGAVGTTQLAAGAVQDGNIAAGAVDNTKLANPSLTLHTGTGLAGGGEITLGGTRTLSIANNGVGPAQLAPGTALANLSLGGLSLGMSDVPTFAGAKLLNTGTGDNKPELLFDRGITPKGRVTFQRSSEDPGWSGLVFSINADWNDVTGYVYDDGGKSQSILQMEYEYTDVHGNQLNELNWTVAGHRTLHFTTDVHNTSRSICNLFGATTIDFHAANPTILNDEAGRIFRAIAARDDGDIQAWVGNYSDSAFGAGIHLASRSTTNQWSDNPADWVSLWALYSDPRGNGSNEFGIVDRHAGANRFLINQAGNIGIKGNINPQYALDVNGDVNVSGTFRVNGIVATIPKQGISRLAVEMAAFNATTQTVGIAPNSYTPAVLVNDGNNVAKMMSLDPSAWKGRSVKLRMLVAVNGTNGQDIAYRLLISYTTKTLDGSSNATGFVFPDAGYGENSLPDGIYRTIAAPTAAGAAMWIETEAITIPNDATALAATFELAKANAGDTNTNNGYIIECRVTEQ